MDIAGNKLTKNNSEWAIFSIINNAKLKNATLIAWRIIGGKKVTVDVNIRVIRKFRSELVMTPKNSKSKAMLSDLSMGTDKLNFYLPEEMVLFQSKIKARDRENGDVTVEIPTMFAQIDRRKYLRLFVDEKINVNISFYKVINLHQKTTQKFDKTCFDLSAGGLSFIIAKSESKFFKVGDTLEKINIVIESKSYQITAEIVNIFNVEPNEVNKLNYKGQKICVKYSAISKDVQESINNFVFKNVDFSSNVV